MIQDEHDIIIMSRNDANSLIPSTEAAYAGLQLQGKYLPKFKSSIITSDYLLKVVFDEYYVPETKNVKIGVLLRPVKKQQIIEEILKIDLGEDQSWGITFKHQPDKQWALNVLKSLKPDHHFFKRYSPNKFDMKNFTQEQIQKIRALDFSQGKKNAVRRFFRISKEQQNAIRQNKKSEQKKSLESKIIRKKKIIEEVQKDIQNIGQQITQI